MTHEIRMQCVAEYVHGESQKIELLVEGEGDIDHYLETFRAFLVASGFSSDTAKRLCIGDEE